MKITFYFNFLNHHQVFLADEMYRLLGDEFAFVATYRFDASELKGGNNYQDRPYLISYWNSKDEREKSLELLGTSDVCVFGAGNLELEKRRAETGKLSFEVGERWLKRGWINLFSPRLIKWWILYHTKLKNKPFYKLCASSFTSHDDRLLRCYVGKHFKWGYFTKVDNYDVEASTDVSTTNITPLMWCSRYLMLKHPELPVYLAKKLKDNGYRFRIDMYGSGTREENTKLLAHSLGLDDVIQFNGALPNEEILSEMRCHKIFLFTSDRNEGWGAVANESMANGCVLVASNAIGSTAYLVEEGRNGFSFKSEDVNMLYDKVTWLLDHPSATNAMRVKACETMKHLWSPRKAAENLLLLIEKLQGNNEIFIEKGPCSIA